MTTSAFGIEHVSKNAEAEGAEYAVRAAAKKAAKAARPRLTEEQIAHFKAQRAEKIARGEAQAPPPPKVKQDPAAQTREKTTVTFLQGNQPRHLATTGAIGVGGFGVAHHFSKADKKDVAAVVAAGAGGAGTAQVADTLAGATLKRIGHNQRVKAGPLSEPHKKILQDHQRAHGFVDEHGEARHPVSADSHAVKNQYFRHYPKDLPASKVQRLNAVRDGFEGKQHVPLAGAAVAAGSYGAYRVHLRHKMQAAAAQATSAAKPKPATPKTAAAQAKMPFVAAKSAFGVQHEVAKFGIGQALDMGRDALKGLKSGVGGNVNLVRGGAAKAGTSVGGGLRTAGVKLKPLVNTPAKAAAAAGVGGVGAGAILGHKSNN